MWDMNLQVRGKRGGRQVETEVGELLIHTWGFLQLSARSPSQTQADTSFLLCGVTKLLASVPQSSGREHTFFHTHFLSPSYGLSPPCSLLRSRTQSPHILASFLWAPVLRFSFKFLQGSRQPTGTQSSLGSYSGDPWSIVSDIL